MDEGGVQFPVGPPKIKAGKYPRFYFWWSILEKVRTHFQENPADDF